MDLTRLTEQVSKIKVKNVVEILLKYGLWILAFALISGIFCEHLWVTITIFCFAALLFLIAVFGYVYFAIKKPDYLRSEEYNLTKQSLELLGDKERMLNPSKIKGVIEITSSPYNKESKESKGLRAQNE